MGTAYPEIWNALADRFEDRLVRTRPAGGGRMVAYITARTVMNRFDSVVGFENWEDEYHRDPGGSDNILCRLTITLPDGKRITKCDVGSPGNTGDDGEDDKGAVSDAFKRAAVKFGVGRYLYGEGVFLCGEATRSQAALPSPEPSPRPSQGAPPSQARPPASEAQRRYGDSRSSSGATSAPRTGKALYGWLKDLEKQHGVGVLKYVDGWGKLQQFPNLMKDWDEEMVVLAVAEATRRVRTAAVPAGKGDGYEEVLTN